MRPALAFALVLLAGAAHAKSAPPPEAPPQSGMELLSRHGLHDLDDERWNLYGQFTFISSWHPSFHAPYTNLNGSSNSLSPDLEWSFTGTLTAYLGLRLWHGAEAYFVPEVISEQPFSNLLGLGSVIQNFELQKQGAITPLPYRSRLYLRQTFELGGDPVQLASDAMQLGTKTTSRRVVVTAGNFSVLDFLEKNSYAADLRRQFLNMAFLTHAAFDFAADARGYSWGIAAELYLDQWAIRFARLAVPIHPNQLELDFDIVDHYGDQLEIEHDHQLFGRPGAVRVVGFRNRERIGRFDEAVQAFLENPGRNAASCTDFHYGSTNAHAPDLCWVRRDQVKLGIGLNLEQELFDDLGVFFRAMANDGKSEVYSFTSNDRSLSFGALGKGTRWRRPGDTVGLGLGLGWISEAHADYLSRGGVDGFIGDGALRQAPEMVLDAFYSANVVPWVWLTADYQFIANPGYNADRGPLSVFGLRAHAEF